MWLALPTSHFCISLRTLIRYLSSRLPTRKAGWAKHSRTSMATTCALGQTSRICGTPGSFAREWHRYVHNSDNFPNMSSALQQTTLCSRTKADRFSGNVLRNSVSVCYAFNLRIPDRGASAFDICPSQAMIPPSRGCHHVPSSMNSSSFYLSTLPDVINMRTTWLEPLHGVTGW